MYGSHLQLCYQPHLGTSKMQVMSIIYVYLGIQILIFAVAGLYLSRKIINVRNERKNRKGQSAPGI